MRRPERQSDGVRSMTSDTNESGVTQQQWRKGPLLVLCLGSFMTLLDVTIVNVAVPRMLAELRVGLESAGWIISLYTIPLAVFVATFGKLGDVLGKRECYLVGVALFTLASAACALAPNIVVLLVARIFQGTGASLLLPQTLAIISTATPKDKRTTALGVHGSISGIASVLGPLLGGVLVGVVGWRSIFLLNLPLGVIVIVLGIKILPRTTQERDRRLDWASVTLMILALSSVTYLLLEGGARVQNHLAVHIGMPSAIAVLSGAALYYRLRRTQDRDPLIPFWIFRNPSYRLMSLVWASVSAAIVITYLPLMVYAQTVLGLSSMAAGLLVTPMFVCTVVVAACAGRLAKAWTAHFTLAGGLGLFALGLVGLAVTATETASPMLFVPSLLVAGSGLGATFATMQSIAMRDVDPGDSGAASGVINGIRQLSSALGGAVVVTLLAVGIRLAGLDESFSGSPSWQSAYTDSLQLVLLVPVVLIGLCALLTWRQGVSEKRLMIDNQHLVR
ncbi:MFS transporter [Rathayibacter iranicus]|uniref:MFS transporter n=2 Tax=Rathayibacter iranicus TaxID=59737 RepID=A0AAD1AEG1_9MICO|nr:MFS transporter [Rathayibacter iranicus]PPI48264.1 MFS transporter [Rathayibacter iranicus]PPI60895.1 MFS transporter [Rathayibacter iranicus]PPI72577.1 MFS transporter [Rathayibacter iranicus]